MPLDLASYPKKCRTVIKALESLGVEPGWELVRGEAGDYYYWVSPPDQPMLDDSMVLTCRLSDLTLGQWIEDFKGRTGRGADLKRPTTSETERTGESTSSTGKTIIRLR